MWRPVFFAFADDADEWRVSAVPCHEEDIGIGPVIEKLACDRHRVVVRLLARQAGEGEKEQRLPTLRAEIAPQISLVVTRLRAVWPVGDAFLRRETRVCRQRGAHAREI